MQHFFVLEQTVQDKSRHYTVQSVSQAEDKSNREAQQTTTVVS